MSKEIVRKTFCGKIRSVDSTNFTVECVMSDETLDRYDEVIEVNAYRNTLNKFKKHPVLLSSHKHGGDLRAQIGEWKKIWIEGKQLIGLAKYYVGEGNGEADWGFKLAEKGIAAYSVGFIPIKAETLDWEKYEEAKKKGKKVARRIYKEVELIETSQVLIPANPAALQRSIDEEDGTQDAARYYLDNLDQLKDLSDIEITSSNVAEKFLVKDPALDEEDSVVEEELDTKDLENDIETLVADTENKIWEETTNEIRFRVRNPALFKKFRRIVIKSDKPRVFAIYGQLKKGDNKWAIQALRFPKSDGWTMSDAKEWVKEHPVKLLETYNEETFSELSANMEDVIETLSKEIAALSSEVALLRSELSSKMSDETSEISRFLVEIKEKLDDIISAVNVKTIVPNDSYIDNILSDGLESVTGVAPETTTEVESPKSVETVNDEAAKLLKEALDALTDSVKKFTGGKK